MRKYLSILAIALCLIACSKKEPPAQNVLVRYNQEVLTLDEVINLIPNDLLPADSAALFDAIVEGWIEERVLAETAREKLYDISDIERKVSDYRNSLLMQEYLRRMVESKSVEVPEPRVKKYYEDNKDSMILEKPLVKGLFLKISTDLENRERIRNLLLSDKTSDIDNLEQEWMDKAATYYYFQDRWVDWETLTSMIPYRFGNPDEFIDNNKLFETEYDGFSYFLKISDVLHSEEMQPYDYASVWIRELMVKEELTGAERELVKNLISNSIADKKLVGVGYDPLTHKMIEEKKKDEKKGDK